MLIIGLVLAIIGILLLFAWVFSRLRCKLPVEATVSRVQEEKLYVRGGTKKLYIPVLTYTVDGKRYTEKLTVSTLRAKRFTVGQKVTAYINPQQPKELRYGTNLGILLWGLVLTAAGVAILVLTFF